MMSLCNAWNKYYVIKYSFKSFESTVKCYYKNVKHSFYGRHQYFTTLCRVYLMSASPSFLSAFPKCYLCGETLLRKGPFPRAPLRIYFLSCWGVARTSDEDWLELVACSAKFVFLCLRSIIFQICRTLQVLFGKPLWGGTLFSTWADQAGTKETSLKAHTNPQLFYASSTTQETCE